MSARTKRYRFVLIGFLAATTSTSPLLAQASESELISLVDASAEPASGLALARRQIGERDLLGAAATLERVLIAHPGEREPRLLYASLLCRLDDPAGARLELSLLGPLGGGDPGWADVAAACRTLIEAEPPPGARS